MAETSLVHRKHDLTLDGAFHVSLKNLERIEALARGFLAEENLIVVVKLADFKETTGPSLAAVDADHAYLGSDIRLVAIGGSQWED